MKKPSTPRVANWGAHAAGRVVDELTTDQRPLFRKALPKQAATQLLKDWRRVRQVGYWHAMYQHRRTTVSTQGLCRLFVVSLSCFSLAEVPARAQTAKGWEFRWEQLRMDVKGIDEHVGDITKITSVQTLSPPQITDTVTYDPISLNMDAKNAFRAELKYRGQRWGGGISGWFLRTGDSVAGRVSSPTPMLTAASNTVVVNTVLMWRELLPPVVSDLEGSRRSPVDFFANGQLRTFTSEFFALAALADTDNSGLELIIGTKVARVRTRQDQGFRERAFVRDFFSDVFGPGLSFSNNISLSSAGDAYFLGVGPMMGLAGRTKWRRLHLDASVTGSVLIGGADQSGTFTDIDDVTLTQGSVGPFPSIRSDFKFSKSESTLVPVTELQLKLLVDITRSIAVGVSSFASIWSSAPVPPTFMITHAGVGPGLDWKVQQRSLRFGAVGLVGNVRF